MTVISSQCKQWLLDLLLKIIENYTVKFEILFCLLEVAVKCFKNRASVVKTVYAVVSSILLLSLAMLFVPTTPTDSSDHRLEKTEKIAKVTVADFDK